MNGPREWSAPLQARRRTADVLAWCAIGMLTVVALCQGVALIAMTSDDAFDFTFSDALIYSWMAEDFLAGDFRLLYLTKHLAHQGFLYPLVAAGFRTLFLDDEAAYRWVNVVLRVLTVPVVYVAMSRCSRRVIGIACTAIYVFNPYFIVYSTLVLSETLFMFLSFAAFAVLLARCNRPRPGQLWIGGLITGAAYLTRLNGLFLAFAIALGYAIQSLSRRPVRWRNAVLGPAVFGAGVLVAGLPSFFARYQYHGNPLYTGHLPNYLWVDTYDEAHLPEPPRFGPRDYFSTHTASQAVQRLFTGYQRMLWVDAAPYDAVFCVAWMAGLVAALLSRSIRRRYVGWLIVLFVVSLPLAWGYIAYDTIRIPYVALFPLQLLCLALGLRAVDRAIRRAFAAAGGRWLDAPAGSLARLGAATATGLLLAALVIFDYHGIQPGSDFETRQTKIRKVDLYHYHVEARLHAWNKWHPDSMVSDESELIETKPW